MSTRGGGGSRSQQQRRRRGAEGEQEQQPAPPRKPPAKRTPRKKFKGAPRRLDEADDEFVVRSLFEGALPVERKLVGIFPSKAEANAAARAAFYSEANPFGASEAALAAAGAEVAELEAEGLLTLSASPPPGRGGPPWRVEAARVGGG